MAEIGRQAKVEISTGDGNWVDITKNIALRWTTTPPTEPGWYWAADKGDDISTVVLVDEIEIGGGLFVLYPGISDQRRLTVTDFSHWLGPLPEPAPPVDVKAE